MKRTVLALACASVLAACSQSQPPQQAAAVPEAKGDSMLPARKTPDVFRNSLLSINSSPATVVAAPSEEYRKSRLDVGKVGEGAGDRTPTTLYGCPRFAEANLGRKRWAKPIQ